MSSHLLTLVYLALATGAIFAIIMRDGRRERLRFTFSTTLIMVGLGLALAWIMLPFPR